MTILGSQLCSHYDAAIIDLDGTMVDTMGDFVMSINLMLRDFGYQAVDRNVVALRVGKGSEHLVKSVLNYVKSQSIHSQVASKKRAKKQVILDDAMEAYQRHYRDINGQHAQVYPGVIVGLQALQKAGLKLACLTNKPIAFARELLKLKGLDVFFSEVFGGDSFESKKPHPLPVLKTCEALGTSPSRTLMIGDSSNDSAAAGAAGCPVVLVTYGYNHGLPVTGADADAVVSSFEQIGSSLWLEKSRSSQ
jgi:phosphoglycolate phosphatase